MLVIGVSKVDGAHLYENPQLLNFFDVLIPHAPFDEMDSVCENDLRSFFKNFYDYARFYQQIICSLPLQIPLIKNQKICVYARSIFGQIAILLARNFPNLLNSIIVANSPIYVDFKQEGEDYFRVNLGPGWRGAADRLLHVQYSHITNPTFSQTYNSQAARTYYDEKMAKNVMNCAIEYWSSRTTISSESTKHFFDLVCRDIQTHETCGIDTLIRNKITIPAFFGFGIYDGLTAPPYDWVKLIPKNCTFHFFSQAAHWINEDPTFLDVILNWWYQNINQVDYPKTNAY